MTKKEIIEKYDVSQGQLTNMILGYPKFKYSAEKKRSGATGERGEPELIENVHYQILMGKRSKIYFTDEGIEKISKQFGVRK